MLLFFKKEVLAAIYHGEECGFGIPVAVTPEGEGCWRGVAGGISRCDGAMSRVVFISVNQVLVRPWARCFRLWPTVAGEGAGLSRVSAMGG